MTLEEIKDQFLAIREYLDTGNNIVNIQEMALNGMKMCDQLAVEIIPLVRRMQIHLDALQNLGGE